MTNNSNSGSGPSVRPVRRDQPDLAKLARALIMLAESQLQAEADAETTKSPATPDVEEAA